jgi:biotin transport system substrate-specific component
MMIFSSFFAALMVVGAYIRVPVGPVPIVLSSMFVLLAGLVLGPGWGTASVAVYLLLGFIGLPVFSSGGGPAYFAGPTGGYLVGYLAAAALAGALSRIGHQRTAKDTAALVTGTVVIYAAGVPWLKLSAEMSWSAALSAGLAPFLVGDALKVAASLGIAAGIRRAAPALMRAEAPPQSAAGVPEEIGAEADAET